MILKEVISLGNSPFSPFPLMLRHAYTQPNPTAQQPVVLMEEIS